MHILPLTKPVSNAGELYRQYRAGDIELENYLEAIGEDTCTQTGCLRPATSSERGVRLCHICAMERRNRRRG